MQTDYSTHFNGITSQQQLVEKLLDIVKFDEYVQIGIIANLIYKICELDEYNIFFIKTIIPSFFKKITFEDKVVELLFDIPIRALIYGQIVKNCAANTSFIHVWGLIKQGLDNFKMNTLCLVRGSLLFIWKEEFSFFPYSLQQSLYKEAETLYLINPDNCFLFAKNPGPLFNLKKFKLLSYLAIKLHRSGGLSPQRYRIPLEIVESVLSLEEKWHLDKYLKLRLGC